MTAPAYPPDAASSGEVHDAAQTKESLRMEVAINSAQKVQMDSLRRQLQVCLRLSGAACGRGRCLPPGLAASDVHHWPCVCRDAGTHMLNSAFKAGHAACRTCKRLMWSGRSCRLRCPGCSVPGARLRTLWTPDPRACRSAGCCAALPAEACWQGLCTLPASALFKPSSNHQRVPGIQVEQMQAALTASQERAATAQRSVAQLQAQLAEEAKQAAAAQRAAQQQHQALQDQHKTEQHLGAERHADVQRLEALVQSLEAQQRIEALQAAAQQQQLARQLQAQLAALGGQEDPSPARAAHLQWLQAQADRADGKAGGSCSWEQLTRTSVQQLLELSVLLERSCGEAAALRQSSGALQQREASQRTQVDTAQQQAAGLTQQLAAAEQVSA